MNLKIYQGCCVKIDEDVERIVPNEKPQTELLDESFKETIFEVWK